MVHFQLLSVLGWNHFEFVVNFEVIIFELRLILNSWVEKSISRQVLEAFSLRMCGREDSKFLFICVQKNFDDHVSFMKAIIDDRTDQFGIRESLINDSNDHNSRHIRLDLRIVRNGLENIVLLLGVADFDLPEVFAKAVAIAGKDGACFLYVEPFLFAFEAQRSTNLLVLEVKVIPGGYVAHFRPIALLLATFLSVLLPNRRHSKPISSPGHKISNNTFMCLPRINLPKLFHCIHFDSDPVL